MSNTQRIAKWVNALKSCDNELCSGMTLRRKDTKELQGLLEGVNKGTHLFVVATVVEGIHQSDSFGDILLITTSSKQAYRLKRRLNARQPLKTIKYEYLQTFKEAVIMTFSLGEVITNNNE